MKERTCRAPGASGTAPSDSIQPNPVSGLVGVMPKVTSQPASAAGRPASTAAYSASGVSMI